MGNLDPHLMHGSLGPPESSTETASQSVQPFFSGLTSVTDQQTDHGTQSVTVGRIYVSSTAMQPNNTTVINTRTVFACWKHVRHMSETSTH